MTQEEQEIHRSMVASAIVFFKDFIDRITLNDDGAEDKISSDVLILSILSLQTSLELALKALILKKKGLGGIIESQFKGVPTPELFRLFESNELKTKSFNRLKKLSQNEGLMFSMTNEDYEVITDFQDYRNGVVHCAYRFQEGDYFDLKYDIIYFVTNVLIKALCSGDDDVMPSEFLERKIGRDYHQRLINYRPYVQAMKRMAGANGGLVLKCISCWNGSYAHEEKYCYCCNFYGELHSFRDCDYCGKEGTMIFDGLNLHNNGNTTKGLCLYCQSDAMLFVCPTCSISYNLDISDQNEICTNEFCHFRGE